MTTHTFTFGDHSVTISDAEKKKLLKEVGAENVKKDVGREEIRARINKSFPKLFEMRAERETIAKNRDREVRALKESIEDNTWNFVLQGRVMKKIEEIEGIARMNINLLNYETGRMEEDWFYIFRLETKRTTLKEAVYNKYIK